MHSPDLSQENIAKIRAIFPDCVTEAAGEDGVRRLAVDFDQLRQVLSDHIVEGPQERYRLDWPGKREALLTANAPIAKTLRPVREESVDFDITQNLFIEGDNLDALKLMQESYLGQVKMIYIDPPYNTGSDFIYADDFSESTEEFFVKSLQSEADGSRLITNSDASGRYHSKWLSMIYPRLKISKSLLRDDGFIVVSIDDVECHALKKIMDEIFGEANFIASLVWDRNRKNDARYFSVGHEYMLVYVRSIEELKENDIRLRAPKEGVDEIREVFSSLQRKHGSDWDKIAQDLKEYYKTFSDGDPRLPLARFAKVDKLGPYRDDGNINWPGGGGPTYSVLHPETQKPCKLPKSGWRYPTKQRFDEEVQKGRIVFGPDETTVPRVRMNLFDNHDQVLTSVRYSYAQTATLEFEKIFDGLRVFDNPKNYKDLSLLIDYMTGEDDLILDFFAGSASTFHAVLHANAKSGTNRRVICVQLDEEVDVETVAGEAGFSTIAQISQERIRRAGKMVLAEQVHANWNRDVGFRAFKIDSSNMTDVFYRPDDVKQDELFGQVDNVKPDRTGEDLLFQVLIDWGVELTLPIAREMLYGKTVYCVDGNALVACFDAGIDDELVKSIAARSPLRVVFRDTSFARDADRINAEQLFQQLSPSTEVKAI